MHIAKINTPKIGKIPKVEINLSFLELINLGQFVSDLRKLVLTLYNVCSVHRGMFSTSGGVQYIEGIP